MSNAWGIPGFLSIPMPNTFSMGWNYVQNYITKHGLEKPKRDVFEVLEKRCKRFFGQGKLPGQGFAIHGDVRDLSMNEDIKNGSVKLVFSSPPYLKGSSMVFTTGSDCGGYWWT